MVENLPPICVVARVNDRRPPKPLCKTDRAFTSDRGLGIEHIKEPRR
jgi:hypothetical protein